MKAWLCFIAGPGSIEDIDELVSPVIQYFDGLKVMFHGSIDSAEGQYLEANKKSGKIVYGEYVGRHDHSRNRLLFETGIKEGEWLVSLDTLERVPIEFAQKLAQLIGTLNDNQIDVLYYYGKPYLIRFREDMKYAGSPHEGLTSTYKMNQVEYNNSNIYQVIGLAKDFDIRVNMRPIKRASKFHWVGHYLQYYLLPSTNQCLLGLENRGNPNDLFPKRDAIRLKFRAYLNRMGVEATADAVIEHMKKPLSEELRELINSEKILSDAYRYFIMNDRTVNDNHHWKDMIKI